MDQAPFWGKNKFPPNLQKGVPAKFHKMELPPNLKIPNQIYRPASAGNLPIPAKLPVNRWDATQVISLCRTHMHISLSGRWILAMLKIPAFHFPKILNQFLAYISMYLCTICSRSSLQSRKNHILSQENTNQVTARHVRFQFWPFSVQVEKFVGIR